MDAAKELFSFHLLTLPATQTPGFLLRPLHAQGIAGLRHAENCVTMRLGEPVMSRPRYQFGRCAVFAWWTDVDALDRFLAAPAHRVFADGWHVRLKLYRRWGHITELSDALVDGALAQPERPVVAVTLARLKLSQAFRFTQWGKPVERQVRDHAGKTLALAAVRPPGTFCTFSIWNTEADMVGMVTGRSAERDGSSHRDAMKERVRQDFHHEFTTLRFVPIQESGVWDGCSTYTLPR